MAYSYIHNQLPAAYGDAAMNIANMYSGAGYTQTCIINNSGFATNGTTTNNLVSLDWTNTNYCGFIERTPDGKEISFQRNTGAGTGNAWRIGYSAYTGFRDCWITFNASAVSGNKFTISDGTVTKTFWIVTGAAGGSTTDFNVACSIGANAVAQATAFMTAAASAVSNGLGMSFVNTGTGTVYGIKTTRTNISSVVQTSGTPLTAFAPSASFLPVAYSDQKMIWGGGSDQSPTFTTWLGTSGAYYQNGAANGSSPYHSYVETHATGGAGTLGSLFFVDRLTNCQTGEFDDVVINACNTNIAATVGLAKEGTATTVGWLGGTTVAGATWGGIFALVYVVRNGNTTMTVVWPGAMPTDPFTGKHCPIWLEWIRRPATISLGTPILPPYGYKGKSTLLRWIGSTITTGDLLSVVGTGDYVCFGNLAIAGHDNTVISL